jgi:hypothetical protein
MSNNDLVLFTQAFVITLVFFVVFLIYNSRKGKDE